MSVILGLCASLLWVYADKVFCHFLRAKRVSPNSPDLFNFIVSRKSQEREDGRLELYVYDGSSSKCFILESSGGATILINEELYKQLDKRDSFLVYDELEKASKVKEVRALTKFYALIVIIFSLLKILTFNSKAFKLSLSFFLSLLVFPFIITIFRSFYRHSPRQEGEVINRFATSQTFSSYEDIYGLQVDQRESLKAKMNAFLESHSTFDYLRGLQ